MEFFKVGDKVERIAEEHLGMEKGDIGTIKRISPTGSGFLLEEFYDKNYPHCYHDIYNFKKLVEFKIGDRVRIIKKCDCQWENACNYLNKIGKIFEESDNKKDWRIRMETGFICSFYENQLIKESIMSRYEELKLEIGAIESWDKKADDILEELYRNTNLRVWIETYGITGSICIVTHGRCLEYICKENDVGGTQQIVSFNFYSQCGKLEAFKKALLWLLDHSNIKDENQEKIKELEVKIEEFRQEIKKLKERK